MKILKPGDVVLAVDPGQTTGICCATYRGGDDGFQFDVMACREIVWVERFALRHYVPAVDWIVTESFTLYESKKDSQVNSYFPSVRVIGILEALVNEMPGVRLDPEDIVFQGASQRKSVKVQEKHLMFVRGSAHKRDAYQHLRYFIIMKIKAQKEEAAKEARRANR